MRGLSNYIFKESCIENPGHSIGDYLFKVQLALRALVTQFSQFDWLLAVLKVCTEHGNERLYVRTANEFSKHNKQRLSIAFSLSF